MDEYSLDFRSYNSIDDSNGSLIATKVHSVTSQAMIED